MGFFPISGAAVLQVVFWPAGFPRRFFAPILRPRGHLLFPPAVENPGENVENPVEKVESSQDVVAAAPAAPNIWICEIC